MKSILAILILICFSSLGQKNPQIAYKEKKKCIRKAGKQYAQGNYAKSLRWLDKADQINYPCCGNLAMLNSNAVNYLRCRNYLRQCKFDLARFHLDSIITFNSNFKADSLRWISYQLELGKDSLSSIIDASLENSIYIDSGFYHLVYVPLPDTANLAKFHIEYWQIKSSLTNDNYLKEYKEYWISEFKNSNLYELIKI